MKNPRSGDCPVKERRFTYPFSAKGAEFIISLGQRPRESCNAKPLALKARFILATIIVGLMTNRRVESRFQRWSLIRSVPWGDAPGWHEDALLALNNYRLPNRRTNKTGGLETAAP